MTEPGDERVYIALVVAVLVIAALGYLSSIPRGPVHGVLNPAATASPPPAPRPTAGIARTAGPPAPALASASDVSLSVTLWPRGPQHAPAQWEITCPPASAACRTALRQRALLDRELGGPCPTRRTGASEALVVGLVAGRHVAGWFDQRDACGVERWKRLLPVLTAPTPPAGGEQSART